jgi:hypothetical protein
MTKSLSETILKAKKDQNSLVNDFFNEELNLITDPIIRSFVESVLIKATPFWRSPASLAPEMHPPDEYDELGLCLHTKRVVRVAALLISTYDCSQEDFNCLVAAALLHDITKALSKDRDEDDDEEPVVFHDAMHPYTVDNFVNWCRTEDSLTADESQPNTLLIPEEQLFLILRLIRCSHGPWSPIPETIPSSSLEKILHMADLVASTIHRIIDGQEVRESRWITEQK